MDDLLQPEMRHLPQDARAAAQPQHRTSHRRVSENAAEGEGRRVRGQRIERGEHAASDRGRDREGPDPAATAHRRARPPRRRGASARGSGGALLIKVVLFDVGGTLIYAYPSVGGVYSAV